MPDRSDTERMRSIQARRARHESDEADRSTEDQERQAHARRAEKAAYLRDKLDEQAQAPDE